MAILSARGLKKYYGAEPNIVRALEGVDIDIMAGEFVAVVGASGSGKSTLLHMLGGLDKPTNGSITVSGVELGAMTNEQLVVFRRRNVGFVFQSYNLIPIFNVYENIVLPVELDGRAADDKYINGIIDAMGLKDKVSAMPDQLSGGQQQRVAIARALAAKPSILLADEPTGNLDTKTSKEVLSVLKSTAAALNQTTIMITHDARIARLADRILHIEDGKIVREASGV